MDMVGKTSVSPDGDRSSVIYQESNVVLATQVSGWDTIVKCMVHNLLTEIIVVSHAESAVYNRLARHLPRLQDYSWKFVCLSY
jgi:hypothetical protein